MFGGRSVEHDVSIITGLQACEVLDARHEPVPLYIDRDGRWFAGESLRDIDTYRADTLKAEPVVFDIGSGLLRSQPVEQRRGMFGRGEAAARRINMSMSSSRPPMARRARTAACRARSSWPTCPTAARRSRRPCWR